MEIAPGIHRVRMLGANAFLVDGDALTLIDAGMIGSRRPLERYLGSIGRDMADLRRIVCTHGHPDHIGGVHELIRDRPDVEVLMHRADIDTLGVTLRDAVRIGRDGMAAHRGRLLAYVTRLPAQCRALDDGDTLAVAGGLRVVHTPGHTPGSICLYAQGEGVLFTGDVLQVTRAGRLTFASRFFSHDLAQARASIARLTELDVRMIAFSHYPAWGPERDPNGALQELADRATEAAASAPQTDRSRRVQG